MTTYTIDTANIPPIDTTNRIVPRGFVLKLKRTNLKTRYRVFEKDNNNYKEKTVNEEQKYPETLTLFNEWNLIGNYFPRNNIGTPPIWKWDASFNKYIDNTDTLNLDDGYGYWVKSNKLLKFYKNDEYDISNNLSEGWNLISVNKNISISDFKIPGFEEITYAWKWDAEHQKYIDISNAAEIQDNLLNILESLIGYWVNIISS